MGNQGSALGDEPTPGSAVAQRNLQHFYHTFKGTFHTSYGPVYTSVFGEFSFDTRLCKINCKSNSFEIQEDQGISTTKKMEVGYETVSVVFYIC